MPKNDDVVIIDDEGLLSLKDKELTDFLVGGSDDDHPESLDSATTTLEEAQALGIGVEADEENPKPLNLAGDFAKKTEH